MNYIGLKVNRLQLPTQPRRARRVQAACTRGVHPPNSAFFKFPTTAKNRKNVKKSEGFGGHPPCTPRARLVAYKPAGDRRLSAVHADNRGVHADTRGVHANTRRRTRRAPACTQRVSACTPRASAVVGGSPLLAAVMQFLNNFQNFSCLSF